jgi:hypothetical protein
MTFQEPSLITSCDFWASTDGTHSPTGLKFYDKPGGTLLASTSSFTSPMRQTSYNFLFIPPVVLPYIYFEIYKSTTWQVWIDTLSCNTCYDPSETPTPSFSRFPTPSLTPQSPSVSSSEEPSPSLTESLKPVSSNSLPPSISLSISPTISPSVTSVSSNSLTPSISLSKTPESSLTQTITPVLKLTPSYSPINMSGLESLFSGNSTLATIIQDSGQSDTLMGLSGAAIGVGGLSFLILAYKFIAKKFAPGPDGKRPSISEVASSLFSSAKAKATEIAKDIGEDLEQQVKAAVKDPKSAMGLLKDPKSALNFAKTGAAKTLTKVVKENVPASESGVVLDMVNKVLSSQGTSSPESQGTSSPEIPAEANTVVPTASTLIPVSQNEVEVPEVDITEAEISTDTQVSQGPLSVETHVRMTSIQVSEDDLEAVKQMLALMKKPHTVLDSHVGHEKPNQS